MGEGHSSISVFLWWGKGGFCGNLVTLWHFINNFNSGPVIVIENIFYIIKPWLVQSWLEQIKWFPLLFFFFLWFPLHAYSFFSVYNLGKCSVLYEHIVNIFIITSNVDHQLCFISTEKIQKIYKYVLVYSTMEHYERFRTSARLDCVILNYIWFVYYKIITTN